MNRRTAMLSAMLLGGWLPRGLKAQSQGAARRSAGPGRGRLASQDGARPKKAAAEPEGDEPPPAAEAEAAEPEGSTAPPFAEPGYRWQKFDVSRYTAIEHAHANPQNAIVEWVIRRTGTGPWHGEKVAALSASRSRVLAYNDAKNLAQVAEIVGRFTDPVSDNLTVHVRFVAAVDTRWRYAVYSRLTPVGRGPDGQQVWTLNVEDSAFVLTQMQVYQGFRLIAERKVELVNGQTMTMTHEDDRGFVGGMERENAGGLGFQPKAEKLKEGVTLKFSPLLTHDGDALDAAIDLSVNNVKGLHRTRVIAPREVGPAEITIDVPEVTGSHLSLPVKGWKLGQTLLVSGGIQPGLLQNKGGFMNLRIPGTVPTGTELLIFLDVEAAPASRRD